MIRVRGMHKSYRIGKLVNEVLRGVDLDIEDGEFVSIVGPSGSGKSTLLHAVGGLDRDYTGTIEVDERDLAKLSDTELSDYRNRRVGFVFQSFYLLSHLPCIDNVALPYMFARDDQQVDHDKALDRAREVLELVGLSEKVDALPTTLSGGQRQRVAIARALFHKPTLVLADEPTGNLDAKMGDSIIELFRQLNEREKLTVLIVTHDPRIAASADRKILVADGQLTEVEDPAGAMFRGVSESDDGSNDEAPAQEAAK